MSNTAPRLAALLKEHFGFDAFRPLQEEIIRDVLSGKDVFALLPTGGGKSLCYQLPALAREGLTVVVSPLIALMKDQVDGLQANGIAATFLNSSLPQEESRARFRDLHRGRYRLLYIAPERLMLEGTLEHLAQWRPSLIAVDEAHCISEWGHDFRPEYRHLARLREAFPGAPILALTATATERVRADIVAQLALRKPSVYVASFNRPNLLYRVEAKTAGFEQTLAALRSRPRDAGIVYCQSRKTAESLAERLAAAGVAARPYHAGLEPEERARNQEAFLRDEARVICATVAFGMGINKPNVRFVIHYDLPKNLEGYYQETGRAGRDGLPAECVLLFNAADMVKQKHFIEQKTDPEEQRMAREQLRQVVHFAESSACRRQALLAYFGEQFGEVPCGGCDVCLDPRETFDGTVLAQKLLSCAVRVRQKSGFSFGLNHIADVLRGRLTEGVKKWGHESVSTFGIGADFPKEAWQAFGRELIRMGMLEQTGDKFPVVAITARGREALRSKERITLTKPAATAGKRERARGGPRAGDIACDETLFELLRALRSRLAAERGVPAYVVFGDVTLRWCAREYPDTLEKLGRMPGVGRAKLEQFGGPFVGEIRAYLAENPRCEPA